jgi:dihydroceramide fatty acyl 2-hydroxylase
MVERVALFVTGAFTWTFVEYVIHGWLSHTFRTFATPLHAVHHRDPRAVFTIGAWIPISLVWITLAVALGPTSAFTFFTGLVAGFVMYEGLHYRIHFCWPSSRAEAWLRARHLVHHEFYPNACFGVTSALWDLFFGTEPMGSTMVRLCESVALKPPSTGSTNVYKLGKFLPGVQGKKRDTSRQT